MIWRFAIRLPGLFRGQVLHRAALGARARGCHELSDSLFSCAAARYRTELEVERLARLRVHETLVRAERCDDASQRNRLLAEAHLALNRLERIDSLDSPHPLILAREAEQAWFGHPVTGHTPEPAAAPFSRAA